MNFARFCWLNASKFPEREFIIESYPSKGIRKAITWKQLNDQANKLANFMIKECGVKKGDIVVHLMMNSIEWYVCYMAVLKTGATVTPLNFRFASSDINYAADVTKYKEIIKKGDPTNVLVETADDEMAELMFTSGTTGAPKPVCHSHDTLFHIGIGCALTYNEGYNSVYLAPHPFYHSGTLFLSFPSYIAAGKILMPMEIEPKYYLRTLADEKCTGGWNTVPVWSDVINAILSGDVKLQDYDLSALKHIEIGAQPVPYVLLENSRKVFPNLPVANIYGITEGGGGGTINLYDEDIMRKPGFIGKPTVFMEAKVVDDKGQECPPGTVGELLLKGPRLMKEYAFNPEMTARTIEKGWLHTGDLAYKDEEGYFCFVDRAKDLIIRGGENIFPVEIEGFLLKHPKIQDVAVMGYPHPRFVEIVLAVIQTRPGEKLTDEEVLKFCEEKGLAKFKWPEKLIYTNIPRNPAGKIEKPKLRETYVKPAKEAMEKEFKKA